MNRSKATVAAVLFVPVVIFVALPAARFLQADRENLTLDDAARRGVPGSFVRLSAGVTHYELAGPPGAATVLLIPGFSTPYNVWDPTFDGLVQAGFRVLRYELYGRGWSDRPDAQYEGPFFAR